MVGITGIVLNSENRDKWRQCTGLMSASRSRQWNSGPVPSIRHFSASVADFDLQRIGIQLYNVQSRWSRGRAIALSGAWPR